LLTTDADGQGVLNKNLERIKGAWTS